MPCIWSRTEKFDVLYWQKQAEKSSAFILIQCTTILFIWCSLTGAIVCEKSESRYRIMNALLLYSQ